jgi:hypothetical protein
MAEVTRTKELDIAPDELWSLIGDFHGMHKWAAIEPTESLDGGKRRKFQMGPNTLIESLVDEGERSYTYAIDEGPLPVQNYTSTMSVSDDGNGKSVLNWVANFEPAEGSTEEAASQIVGMVYDGGIAGIEKAVSER